MKKKSKLLQTILRALKDLRAVLRKNETRPRATVMQHKLNKRKGNRSQQKQKAIREYDL